MKINLNQTIKNFDGTVAMNETGKAIKVLEILTNALFTNKPDMGNAEKMERWVIAKKVKKAKDTLEVTLEEATKLKDWVISSYGTLVAGQVSDLLEGVEDKE